MNSGFPSVKLHRLIELDYSATGTASLTFYTDLPGNAIALRETNDIPPTATRRVVAFHLLGTTKGKLLKIRIAPTAQFRLFGIRIYARSLGRSAGAWGWHVIPVVETPDGWEEINLGIERTPDGFQEIPLPLDHTSNEWNPIPLAGIEQTPDAWETIHIPVLPTPNEWSEVRLEIEETPNTWTLIHLPIPQTPDEWTSISLPIDSTPDLLRWAEIAMDE